MVETSLYFDKTMDLLKTSPLFSKVEFEVLKEMLKEFTLLTVNESVRLDDSMNMKYFHIIIKGRLKFMKFDKSSMKYTTIFLLQEGDVFDIFPLLDGKEHVVQIVTIDSMLILRAPIERVRKWINNHPNFNEAFLPYIGEKLIELKDRSIEEREIKC